MTNATLALKSKANPQQPEAIICNRWSGPDHRGAKVRFTGQ
jgi:hypothetical protein